MNQRLITILTNGSPNTDQFRQLCELYKIQPETPRRATLLHSDHDALSRLRDDLMTLPPDQSLSFGVMVLIIDRALSNSEALSSLNRGDWE